MQDDYRRQVLNRWKSIEGHVRAVRGMLEDDRYCPDIIKQTTAVQGAIDSVNALLLANHLHTCATAAIRGDDPAERERMIRELLELFRGGPQVSWNRSLASPWASGPSDDRPGSTAAPRADRPSAEEEAVATASTRELADQPRREP